MWGTAEIPDYGVIPTVAVHFSFPRAILDPFGMEAETFHLQRLTRLARRGPSRNLDVRRVDLPICMLPTHRVPKWVSAGFI